MLERRKELSIIDVGTKSKKNLPPSHLLSEKCPHRLNPIHTIILENFYTFLQKIVRTSASEDLTHTHTHTHTHLAAKCPQ